MSQNFINNNPVQSVFEKNYIQISESKKEILNQKYNCGICLEIIKHENPFFCYQCQKIYHHSCLKFWDSKQKQMNRRLSCPNCRNELPLEQWKVLRNFDEMRTKDALIYNQLGKSSNSNSNDYMHKSMSLFKFIINKLYTIHPKITPQINYNLNNLIEVLKYNITNPSIEEISKVIVQELDIIEKYITNTKMGIKKEEIKYKNQINIKYMTKEEGVQEIFCKNFVDNNINNIFLIINGKQSPLIDKYYLKKGENIITLCIKNTLTDLSDMFSYCKTLYNIDELKYLNTKYVTNFSNMFQGTSISNIQALQNWDTSKSENFKSMFSDCKLLTNIEPLKNWNVSNVEDFSFMFCSCSMIKDLKPLEKWNVSNGENFKCMFADLEHITDISPLKNWNVANSKNFEMMFRNAKSLKNKNVLKNWKFLNNTDFDSMFRESSVSNNEYEE